MTHKPFPQQTVLVTGASRGIGAAIAERFAQVGMNVVIHYLKSHEAANGIARRCLEYGSNVLTAVADLRDRQQIERMRDKLQINEMMPDILVNNAAIAHYGTLDSVTEQQWDEVMEINLKGTFLMTQTFMSAMVKQKYGRIINISSIWGVTGASCEVVYSTAKGGINAFSKALAKELAPSNITVNVVAPGAVAAGMMSEFTQEEIALIESDIPAGRLASAEEIAALVYFLALPESGYINGQIISPNGGWLT
jgi:3-oxoacyl-[acyl-carrier protein] reductase